MGQIDAIILIIPITLISMSFQMKEKIMQWMSKQVPLLISVFFAMNAYSGNVTILCPPIHYIQNDAYKIYDAVLSPDGVYSAYSPYVFTFDHHRFSIHVRNLKKNDNEKMIAEARIRAETVGVSMQKYATPILSGTMYACEYAPGEVYVYSEFRHGELL